MDLEGALTTCQQSDSAQTLGFTGKAGPVNSSQELIHPWRAQNPSRGPSHRQLSRRGPTVPDLLRPQAWLHL